ncbi:MAG: hypothetical protein L0Z53_05470 [Acidobacteriales bacterium]|nr:hypothetical protein [Terriglobales bacterium]
MSQGRQIWKRYNLIVGEETYASSTAQNPATARRVKSLIPSLAGHLQREQRHPTFLPATLVGGAVGFLDEFNWFDSATKTFRKFFFAATSTKLYKQLVGTDTDWVEVTAVGALAGFPVARSINNLYHLSDGSTAWIFDGSTWQTDGLPIPLNTPDIDTATAGTLTITVNRFYWTSWEDQTPSRPHESSSSPTSAGTGAITNKQVKVRQSKGTVTTSAASTSVTGSGTEFTKYKAGMKLYTAGQLQGTIQSITNDTSLILAANAATTVSGVRFVIAPSRATHWVIYASESENSKVGFLLARVAVTTVEHIDQSPFANQSGSTFGVIERPIRNDPPMPTKVMEVHKTRIFRRRETQPNFFNLTAQEEVSSTATGAPEESVPGTDDNTESDIVNEHSYPDESDEVRGMVHHGDALYIGTEDEIIPLYGESYDDFVLSDVRVFRVGIAGAYAGVSTPKGLAFGSTDRKVYLYPSAGGAPGQDSTSTLIDLSRPKLPEFRTIKNSELRNWHLVYYKWNERDWLVTCFRNNSDQYRTWVYELDTNGWFQFDLGVASLAVFEIADGVSILVGGGGDGKVYVLDDLSGTFPGTGNYAEGLFRPALIDFAAPEIDHVVYYLEYEKSDAAMPVTVTYWLDPNDADNPGVGTILTMTQTKIGANRFRGFFALTTGAMCHRILVEVKVDASAVNGLLRSLALYAEPADRLAAA